MAKSAVQAASTVHVCRLRPVNLMFDEGVTALEQQAVISGLAQVMEIANPPQHMSVNNFGVWRNPTWFQGGHLTSWNSVDWYVAYIAQQSRKDQLHGGKLLQLLYSEPWQEDRPHYDVLVTSHDIYDDDCDFCIGLAITDFATVISTARFRELEQHTAYHCIVTETMHEVGHVFGLVPDNRTRNVERSLGLHCTNRCIMRQGLEVPHDWLHITADRLNGHGFCRTCTEDLRRYFWS